MPRARAWADWLGAWRLGALGVLLLLLILATAGAGNHFTVLTLPTYDGGTISVIDAEDGPAVQAVGLAVDHGSKMYVSDRGVAGAQNGRVFLARGTNTAVIVFDKLDQPGDIEVTPDQRGLIIARAGGGVAIRYFGVSVNLQPGSQVPAAAHLILKCDAGAIPGNLGSDGYYHFPDVLRPEQTNTTAVLLLNNSNPPAEQEISLADPTTHSLTGEAVVSVKF